MILFLDCPHVANLPRSPRAQRRLGTPFLIWVSLDESSDVPENDRHAWESREGVPRPIEFSPNEVPDRLDQEHVWAVWPRSEGSILLGRWRGTYEGYGWRLWCRRPRGVAQKVFCRRIAEKLPTGFHEIGQLYSSGVRVDVSPFFCERARYTTKTDCGVSDLFAAPSTQH